MRIDGVSPTRNEEKVAQSHRLAEITGGEERGPEAETHFFKAFSRALNENIGLARSNLVLQVTTAASTLNLR